MVQPISQLRQNITKAILATLLVAGCVVLTLRRPQNNLVGEWHYGSSNSVADEYWSVLTINPDNGLSYTEYFRAARRTFNGSIEHRAPDSITVHIDECVQKSFSVDGRPRDFVPSSTSYSYGFSKSGFLILAEHEEPKWIASDLERAPRYIVRDGYFQKKLNSDPRMSREAL